MNIVIHIPSRVATASNTRRVVVVIGSLTALGFQELSYPHLPLH